MSQRSAQKEHTAAAIRSSAMGLFADDGFDKTTIARVAERSGVAVGTVMMHYGSKSELATAAFTDQIADVVLAAFTDLPGTSFDDDLHRVFHHLYDWYDVNAPLSHDLLRESLFSRGEWADRYRSQVVVTLRRLGDLVSAHIDAGRLEPVDDRTAVAEGVFADYTLTLLAGVRQTFPTPADQARHAVALASQRFAVSGGTGGST